MKLVRVFAIALTGLLGIAAAAAQNDQDNFRANLAGFRELPVPISTVASGEFKAEIIKGDTIAYELTYSGLEGNVTQAHIHFGQRFAAGGIALWLCQTAANPDPTKLAPTCPQEAQGPTTVKGNLTVANLVGPGVQGILEQNSDPAAEFAQILKAIRAGVTYANVHSSKFGTGEIRGQIRPVKVTTQDSKSPTSTTVP
jgi:CHRD domain-containing protein